MKQKEEVGGKDLLSIFCFPTFDPNCGFTHSEQLIIPTVLALVLTGQVNLRPVP